MAFNWDAISAIAAAITLLSGFYTVWRGGRRSIISYAYVSVEGKIPNLGKNYGCYDHNIKARRTIFKNTGGHIENVSIRIKTRKSLSLMVAQTSSIDANEITLISEDKDHILVKIPDMPSGETIHVDIMANDSLSEYDRPIGGTSKYRLMPRGEFWFSRALIFVASIVAAYLIFNFAPIFFQRLD